MNVSNIACGSIHDCRTVAELRISSKSTKSREIRWKSYQIHVGTTYLKVILAVGAATSCKLANLPENSGLEIAAASKQHPKTTRRS